jgi:hypothetical protein
MSIVENERKKRENKLVEEAGRLRRDELHFSRQIQNIKERIMQAGTHRTDAAKNILVLLDLIEEQAGKHNGIMKRKAAAIEVKLRKGKY